MNSMNPEYNRPMLLCEDRCWKREASTRSEHFMKHGQEQNTDSVWTGETKRHYCYHGEETEETDSYREGNQNVNESKWVQWAQMHIMMVTGVRNEGQPGALERQRGGVEAGVTEPFIFLSMRCTYVMIMLFNQLLDMPHLSGGWIWDFLFQLMKHGTNTLYVAFIYFCSV